jgi:GT2 family glycosyltransferase
MNRMGETTKGSLVSIVIVNYNGLADSLKCLDSLRALDPRRCMTIVVDNGSAVDASPELAAAHPWATVIRREENGGWAGGNNEGIRCALEHGAKQVILLNNDTIVSASLADRLLEAAAREPRYGIIGPIIHYMDEPEVVMTDGCDFNPPGHSGFFRRHPVPAAQGDPPTVVEVDIVNGCCMMISARVFERIGLIDERFFLIHEESDFCLRAQQAGFACGILAEPLVWHKGSSSFKRSGNGLQRYYDTRNLYLLLRKHRTAHHRGRGAGPSWLGYLRYAYHRYSIEREQGQAEAAEAVVRGLSDALAGRYGPRAPGGRGAAPLVKGLFELGRRVRPGPVAR